MNCYTCGRCSDVFGYWWKDDQTTKNNARCNLFGTEQLSKLSNIDILSKRSFQIYPCKNTIQFEVITCSDTSIVITEEII